MVTETRTPLAGVSQEEIDSWNYRDSQVKEAIRAGIGRGRTFTDRSRGASRRSPRRPVARPVHDRRPAHRSGSEARSGIRQAHGPGPVAHESASGDFHGAVAYR